MNLTQWCRSIVERLAGIEYIAILTPKEDQLSTHAQAGGDRPASDFLVVVSQAIANERHLLAPADFDDDKIVEVIAIPLFWEESPWVIVAGLKQLPPRHVQLLMEQLDLASASVQFERARSSLQISKESQESQSRALIQLTEMLEASHPEAALHILCNNLAEAMGAQRVSYASLNWREKTKLRVSSSVAKFDQRLELNSAITEVAEICISSSHPSLWLDGGTCPNALARLTRLHGDQAAAAVPLPGINGQTYACLVFQWEVAPSRASLEPWKPLWITAGALIETLQRAHEGPLIKTARKVKRGALWLLGANHFLPKAIGIAALSLVLWLAFGSADGSVKADAQVTDASAVSIVSPVEGFIQDVFVVPGETVSAGDIVVKLEDDELQLEKLEQLSKIARFRAEEALATRDRKRGEGAIAKANAEAEEARLAIIEKQIAQTEIRAQTDAVVAQGDLRQRLGSRVDYGEKLLELSPRFNTEILITVDNRYADRIALNQTGTLRLKASPEYALPLEVIRFKPSGEPIDGELKFIATAVLSSPPELLSLEPGMEGTARLELGPMPAWKVWVKPVIETLTLFFWRWWP